MNGEAHGCKSCGGSHFGHNDCPFAEIAEAGSKGETSAVPAAEKPEKELTGGSAETGGEKAAPKCANCNQPIAYFGENAMWWHVENPQDVYRECFRKPGMMKAMPEEV